MESILDIIINGAGSLAGARSVNTALKSIQTTATQTTDHMKAKFDSVKQNVFSLQSALLALGVGAVGRSFLEMGVSLDKTERGLRSVATSSGQAALQLTRLRDISDEFQLPDEEMANSFRLLVSNGIPDAENALRRLANVSKATGEDVSTVTTAMLAGQERTLRKLGIQLIDLGQGQVDIVMGNMEMRVNKTNQSIRAGLMQVFKSIPDSTKTAANSFELQMKRMEDIWDDFKAAVIQGGLGSFITATFKTIADAFPANDIKQRGKDTADFIKRMIQTIAESVAFTMDLMAPLATVTFGVIKKLIDGFNSLPVELQTVGVIGMFMMGTKGRIAMLGLLALVGQIEGMAAAAAAKNKSENKALADAPDIVGQNRGGDLSQAMEILQRQAREREQDKLNEGDGQPFFKTPTFDAAGIAKDSRSYLDTVKDTFKRINEETEKEEKKRAAAIAKAEQERKAGKTGTVKGGKSENQRIVNAQLDELRDNTKRFVANIDDKADPEMAAEMVEAMGRAFEFINAQRQKGNELGKKDIAIIMEQFAIQGDAAKVARQNAEQLEINNGKQERGNAIIKETADAVRDLQDEQLALQQPIGAARDEQVFTLKAIRQLEKDNATILPEQLEWLKKQLATMANLKTENASLTAAEQRRLDHMERIAALEDQISDARDKGTTGFTLSTPNSLETRVNAAERNAKRTGLSFDRDEATDQTKKEMAAERTLAIDTSNTSLAKQIDYENDLLRLAGRSRPAREAELLFLQKRNEFREKGITLGPEEEQNLRDQATALQNAKESAMGVEALNQFTDSLEVNFQTIGRSAQNAYGLMEDALVQFTRTGRLNFAQFSEFVMQEINRMIIRMLILKAIQAVGAAFSFGASTAATSAVEAANAQALNQPMNFATGGSFMVGGDGRRDSTPITFNATRGERVRIDTPGQQAGTAVAEPKVIVQVINSGNPSTPRVQTRRNDMKDMIIKVMYDDVRGNGPLRGLMRG